jgi:hypothetical protein
MQDFYQRMACKTCCPAFLQAWFVPRLRPMQVRPAVAHGSAFPLRVNLCLAVIFQSGAARTIQMPTKETTQ